MAPLNAVNAIDKLLQDIMNNNLMFGGKTLVMGGDFKQTPPVINKGNRAAIKENSIKNLIRNHFQTLKLSINMRADRNQIDFANW